jgi:hypothetical protein
VNAVVPPAALLLSAGVTPMATPLDGETESTLSVYTGMVTATEAVPVAAL